jgi:hypothetical protein
MRIKLISRNAFVARIPSGVRVSSLASLAKILGTKGTLVGYASSLRTRMAYAHFVR